MTFTTQECAHGTGRDHPLCAASSHVLHQLIIIYIFMHLALQAPSKKIAVAALAAVVPASVVAQCPVASFDGYDFSQVMSTCGNLRSMEGCDSCFAGLLRPIVDVLDYIPIDENTTCDSVGTTVADTLGDCQNGFASAIQNQIGFRAAGLLGLRNCEFNFNSYSQTSGVVVNYYNTKGIDVASICPDS